MATAVERHRSPRRRAHLFVLGVDHERPGGGEEVEQRQQDGGRLEAAGDDQPA